MLNLYAGFDPREEVGYHAFCSSVIAHARVPVAIIPLDQTLLRRVYNEGQRDGTNSFIYHRFLVPYLQEFKGRAIFMDGCDMVMMADIGELDAMFDPSMAVQVVKHQYRTLNPRKYIGTKMEAPNEDYFRKNWSSVMIINCEHHAWSTMFPERIRYMPGSYLHQFQFIDDSEIGELPKEWNWMPQEFGENVDAKVIHYTTGIPAFPYYSTSTMAKEWFRAAANVIRGTD